MIFKLSDATLLDEFTICEFDLNQHKTSFDDWNQAFKESIIKRTSNSSQKIFIGLSSGYDSGAIANELTKQKVNFKAYTIMSEENPNIINQRNDKLKNHELIYFLFYDIYLSFLLYLEDCFADLHLSKLHYYD